MESISAKMEPSRPRRPFRKTVIGGLAVLFPPLLTVLIFMWAISTTRQYVLEPVTSLAREGLVWWLQQEIRTDPPSPGQEGYYRLGDDTFVRSEVYDRVRANPGSEQLPQTGPAVYRRYVELTYLRPYYTVPLFLVVFVLLLYFLGRFMAAGIGNFFWSGFERAIRRLPLVRSVYASVKQVTDFFFKEQEVRFTRVVACEYPRPGMWTLAFVTSEGLSDVRAVANEPVLGIFIPTSPMPMTGYALTVLKREVIDLNMTIDQAIQFLVSCGLVLPPQEVEQLRSGEQEAAGLGIRD